MKKKQRMEIITRPYNESGRPTRGATRGARSPGPKQKRFDGPRSTTGARSMTSCPLVPGGQSPNTELARGGVRTGEGSIDGLVGLGPTPSEVDQVRCRKETEVSRQVPKGSDGSMAFRNRDVEPRVLHRNDDSVTHSAMCEICKLEFKSVRGKQVHKRRMHQVEFHRQAELANAGKRVRWSDEERYLLVETEVGLIGLGVPPKELLSKIAECFPHRSKDSLKGQRRLNRKAVGEALIASSTSNMVRGTYSGQGVGNELRTEVEREGIDEDARDASSFRELNSSYRRWSKRLPKSGFTRPTRPTRPKTTGNRGEKRRRMRGAWLNLYDKDPQRCVSRILQGKDIDDRTVYPAGTTKFWKNLFETKVIKPKCARGTSDKWSHLANPFTEAEVSSFINMLKNKAPGQDGLGLADLRKIRVSDLVFWFNRFLEVGDIPVELKRFRTTLIPKVSEPKDPGDFRPITVGSYVRRVFSGLIAKRLSTIPLRHRSQRGFRSEDGCGINLGILRATVDQAISRKKELAYAFVDVSKAFDSVNHEALVEALVAAEIPEGLVTLIRNSYRGNTTLLSNDETAVCSINRGVLQGDPMSPVLFNFVMDCVLDNLSAKIGGRLGDRSMNNLMFADDAVLMAGSKVGLQSNLERFVKGLERFGLSVNPGKCAAVHIKTDGKRKRWFVATGREFSIGGRSVKALSIGDAYKYLGIRLNLSKGLPRVEATLESGIDRLTKSYLKPQQRLEALKINLIPRLEYQLSLGGYTVGQLRGLDRATRAATRRWCHLPKDVPTAVFHADVADGGLGVPSLRTRIPLLVTRRSRLVMAEADAEGNGDVRALRDSGFLDRRLVRDKLIADNFGDENPITGLGKVSEFWRNRLYGTIDGGGLSSHSNGSGYRSRWIRPAYFKKLSGTEFIKAIHVRLSSLPTPSRCSRGENRQVAPRCPSCPDRTANLGHILQNCGKTHSLRIARHNKICRRLEQKLRNLGFEVLSEPHIPVGNSFLKPDIVGHRPHDGTTLILDPTIVSDKLDLSEAEARKTEKYTRGEVFEWLTSKWPSVRTRAKVEIAGIAINWRGAWAPRSVETLISIGVKTPFIESVSLLTLKLGRSMLTAVNRRTS